jgi:hypothetical protein
VQGNAFRKQPGSHRVMPVHTCACSFLCVMQKRFIRDWWSREWYPVLVLGRQYCGCTEMMSVRLTRTGLAAATLVVKKVPLSVCLSIVLHLQHLV